MAMSLQEQLRARRAETERWIREREAQLRRAAAGAEAKGRQVYADAIKTGQKVLARTPAEIRALGEAAMQGRLPQAVGQAIAKEVVRRTPATSKGAKPQPSAKPKPQGPAIGPKIRRQVEAGVSGLVDEASFGLADRVLSAGEAIGAAVRDGDLQDFGEDYDAGMAARRAQDEYDAEHHGTARNVGRVVGFAGSVAALGAPAVTRALVTRLPRGAAILRDITVGATRGPDPRGMAKMAAAGGAVAGAMDQAATDLLSGRSSNARDTLGAVAGGAVGGVATRFAGPTAGGAAGGVTASMVTDLLHGKAPSLDDAFDDGRGGALFGRVGDLAGRHWIAGLDKRAKGDVGDTFSRLKTVMRGERVTGVQKRVDTGAGRYSVADQLSENPRTGVQFIGESKMGPGARLSANQLIAQAQNLGRYVVDYWRFGDVGGAVGAAAAPLGANFDDEHRGPPIRRPHAW